VKGIKIMKNPLKYVGGKFYLKKWIIANFPESKDWLCYVEPFGGAGHVIFEKGRRKEEVEVYNDINQNMINLFKVLQNEVLFNKLIRYLELTPYSREYFYELRDDKYEIPEENENLRKAYKYMVMMKMSFSGNAENCKPSWCYSKKNIKNNLLPLAFSNFPQYLYDLVLRLKEIQIESLDFRKVIEKYDSPETLFYLDPPYWQCESYYQGKFSKQDHYDLSAMLNNIQGKFALSYYYFDELNELYPTNKFRYVEKEGVKCSQRSKEGELKQKSTELLIMNY